MHIARDERPLLFLHIPKTAGTSFLTALQGVFGESAVARVTGRDEELPGALAATLAGRAGSLRAVVGHLPLYVARPHLHALRPFTMLREPVARVFSLYRFFQRAPKRFLRRWRLAPGFSFDAFLACRHPEVFGQVRNGMCRMLSGDRCFSDPHAREFWAESANPALLEAAHATLAGLEYGLVEEMPASLDLLGRRWGMPVPLDLAHDNGTVPTGAEADIATFWRVAALNTLDIALYARARADFSARLRTGGADAPAEAAAAGAVFRPLPNREMAVRDIPGRLGFHPVDAGGFAWLRGERPARLVFAPPVPAGRLRLRVLRVTPDYRLDRVRLTLNDTPVPVDAAPDADGLWGTLTTAELSFRPGPNLLAIDPPHFLSIRDIAPATRDDRYLSVALSWMALLA